MVAASKNGLNGRFFVLAPKLLRLATIATENIMPKQKTRKSAAKRFKRTGTGKLMHARAGRRHIQSKKNAKRRRRLRQDGQLKSTDVGRVQAALPYG